MEHKGHNPCGQYYSVRSLFFIYWCIVILIQYAPGECFIPSARSAHNMLPGLGISGTVLCIVKLSVSHLKDTFPLRHSL